jgi:hypothetical protein
MPNAPPGVAATHKPNRRSLPGAEASPVPYGDSEPVKAVKKLIEELTTRERAMLAAWLLARFDVRGYDREKLPR